MGLIQVLLCVVGALVWLGLRKKRSLESQGSTEKARQLGCILRTVAVGAAVLAIAAAVLFISLALHARKAARVCACVNHFHEIGLGIAEYRADNHGRFPSSLSDVTRYCTTPDSFVCPTTGHTAGSLSDVSKWTDYVFLPMAETNKTPSGTVVLYCPLVNHGWAGLVLYADGSVQEVSPSDFPGTIRNRPR